MRVFKHRREIRAVKAKNAELRARLERLERMLGLLVELGSVELGSGLTMDLFLLSSAGD